MWTSRLIGFALAGSLLALGGCSNNLKATNELLMEENQGLRAQLDERNSALDSLSMTASERERELARIRRELEDARSARAVPAANPGRTGFEGIEGVTGSMGAGEVTATVASDLLFASGSATLRNQAKTSLNSVADVLNNQYAGKPIRIVGHTDTDPIKRSGHKSNYHLGFERAFAVREYLISRGVPANRLHLASFGPDRPAGSKDKSRRVEIVVLVNK